MELDDDNGYIGSYFYNFAATVSVSRLTGSYDLPPGFSPPPLPLPVPLPSSAPVLGAALIAFGAAGYMAKRKRVAAN